MDDIGLNLNRVSFNPAYKDISNDSCLFCQWDTADGTLWSPWYQLGQHLLSFSGRELPTNEATDLRWETRQKRIPCDFASRSDTVNSVKNHNVHSAQQGIKTLLGAWNAGLIVPKKHLWEKNEQLLKNKVD